MWEATANPRLNAKHRNSSRLESDRKRVLIIGMADSVHLARWLSQFGGQDYEFVILSSSPHRRIHPLLRQLIESDQDFTMPWLSRYFSLPMWLIDRLLNDSVRGYLVGRYIKKFDPTFVHVLEFQNAGYSFLRAISMFPELRSHKLLVTPYGSDIFWFRSFDSHRKRLIALLQHADAFSSECERDEKLASSLGFTGSFLPRVPAFGAPPQYSPNASSEVIRNTIAVRGYQNKWGQAKNALRALAIAKDDIAGLDVVMFSCNLKTRLMAATISKRTGLRIVCHPKGALSHMQVQEILARSVVFIGLSKSDGISASMIEAMANGAIPIQSDTSCSNEWIVNGVGGFLVKYDDIEGIVEVLKRIITNPELRALAVETNRKSLESKLSPHDVLAASLTTYREMTRVHGT